MTDNRNLPSFDEHDEYQPNSTGINNLSGDDLRRALLSRDKESLLQNRTKLKEQLLKSASINKQIDRLSEANRDRSIGEVLDDTGRSLAKGGVMIGQTAYGIADLVSRFNPITLGEAIYNKQVHGEFDAPNSRSLDEITAEMSSDGKSVAQDLAGIREGIAAGQSSKLKAQQELIQQKSAIRQAERAEKQKYNNSTTDKIFGFMEDFGSAFGDYIDNPTATIDAVTESAPQMAVPGQITKIFTKKAVNKLGKQATPKNVKAYLSTKAGKKELNKIATITGVSYTAASEGISNGLDLQSEILSTSHEELKRVSEPYRNLLKTETPDSARRILAEKAGLSTTLMSGLLGGLTSKLTGAGKLEGKFFKVDSKLGQSLAAKLTKPAVKGAVTEGVEETLQGGGGQLTSNLAKKEHIDHSQDVLEGVADAAAAGAAIGLASGGGFGVAGNVGKSYQDTAKSLSNVGEKLKNSAKKRKEKNLGASEEVIESVRKGDITPHLKTDENNEFINAKDALDALAKTAPTTEYKESEDMTNDISSHVAKTFSAIASLAKKPEESRTPEENKIMQDSFKRAVELSQRIRKKENTEIDEIVETYQSGVVRDDNNVLTDDNIDKATTSLGSRHYESNDSAKRDIKRLTELKKIDIKDPKVKQRIDDAIESAKSYIAVSKEIFEGKVGKFTGINMHKKLIQGAIETKSPKLIKKSMADLVGFQKKHKTKLKEITAAFEIFKNIGPGKKYPTKDDVPSDKQAIIKQAESRKGLNGKNFKIQGGTGLVIENIKNEVKALDIAVKHSKNAIKVGPITNAGKASKSQNEFKAPESEVTDNTTNDIKSENKSNVVPKKTEFKAESSVLKTGNKLIDEYIARKTKEGTNNRAIKAIRMAYFKNNNRLPLGTEKKFEAKIRQANKRDAHAKKISERKTALERTKEALKSGSIVNKRFKFDIQKLDKKSLTKLGRELIQKRANGKGILKQSELNVLDNQMLHVKKAINKLSNSKVVEATKGDSPKVDETTNDTDNTYELNQREFDKIQSDIMKTRVKEMASIGITKVQGMDLNKFIKKLNSNKDTRKLKRQSKIALERRYEEIDEQEKQDSLNLIRDQIKGYNVAKNAFREGRKAGRRTIGNKLIMPESSTPLSDSFFVPKSKKTDLIKDVPNLFDILRDTDKLQERAENIDELSVLKDLDSAQLEGLSKLVEYKDNFKNTLLKNMQGKKDYFIYEDSMQMFLKEGTKENPLDLDNINENNIDDNVVAAMALASVNWITRKGVKTVNNNKRAINGILGRDSKNEPSNFETLILKDVGTLSQNVREDIGKEIMSLLGIKPRNDAFGEIEQNLINSFGNNAILTLEHMDLIEQSTLPTKLYEGMRKQESEETLRYDKNYLNNEFKETTFIRVKTVLGDRELDNGKILKNVPAPFTNGKDGPGDVINTINDSNKLLEKLFNLKRDGGDPVFEVPTTVTDKILNSPLMKPAKAIREKLAKMQIIKHGLKLNVLDITEAMGEEYDLKIAGYVEDYEDTKHETEHAKIEAINNTIIQDRDNARDFIKTMADKSKSFYYKFQVWKNMRMGYDSNTMNHQASHYHRAIVGIKEHHITVDTNNPEHVDAFLRAFAASMGIKTEKGRPEKYLDQISKLITLNGTKEENEKAQKVINAINAIKEFRKTGKMSEQAKIDITEGTKVGGEKHYSLEGLIAYASYENAIDPNIKGTRFKTNLYREPDGITNGVAISLLQFPMHVNKLRSLIPKINRVGIYTDVTEDYSNYADKSGNNDAYEATGYLWHKNVERFEQILDDPNEDFDTFNYLPRGHQRKTLNRKKILKSKKVLTRNFTSATTAVNAVKSLVGSFVDTNTGEVKKLARDLSKDPLMTNNYGAAIARIIEIFSANRLQDVYSSIADKVEYDKRYKTKKVLKKESKIAITEIINKLNKTASRKDKQIDVNDVLKNPLTWKMDFVRERSFKSLVVETYGVSLEVAINSQYGDIIDARKMLNKAIQVSFLAFKAQYDVEFNKASKAFDGRIPSASVLNEINKKLLDKMPIFKAYFSSNKDDGIMVMKKGKESIDPNDKDAQVRFKTSTRSKKEFQKTRITVDNKTGQITRSSEGKENTGLDAYARVPTWEQNGVGGPVMGVHSIDAAVMLKMLEDFTASNIHDAAIFNLLEATEGSKSLNTAFFDVNREYSIMDSVHEMYTKIFKDLKNTKNPEYKGLYKKVVNQINKDGVLGGRYTNELTNSWKDYTLKDFHMEFTEKTKNNRKAREILFSRGIKSVDQYTDGKGSAAKFNNTDDVKYITNYNKTVAQKLVDSVVKEIKESNDNKLGSNDKTEFGENFQAKIEEEITSKNAEEIYLDLGKSDPIKDSPEHDSHLRTVLQDIVSKVIKPTKLKIRELDTENNGIYSTDDNTIYMTNSLPTAQKLYGTEMSQREIYVHELMHAISHKMIDTNTQAARKLRRFYKQVRDAKVLDKDTGKLVPWIGPKDFMHNKIDKNSDQYAQEYKIAKERYEYIFGNKIGKFQKMVLNPITEKYEKKVISSEHHEFLAIAMTNEAFREKLKTFNPKDHKEKITGNTWFESFTAWVTEQFHKLNDYITGTSDTNGFQTIYTLAGQLVGIDNRAKNKLWLLAENTSDVIGEAFNKLVEVGLMPFQYLVNNKKVKNSKNFVVGLTKELIQSIPYLDNYPAVIQHVRDMQDKTRSTLFSTMAHEIRGEYGGKNKYDGNTYLHDLSREANKLIDQTRLRTKQHISNFLLDKYHTKLTTEKREALINLLKTDVDSLFTESEGTPNYDLNKLIKLFSDSNYRKQEMLKIQKQILSEKDFKQAHKYYISMAKSMGHEMATGRPIEKWSVLNATIIADLDNTGLTPKGGEAKTRLAEGLIDKLATIQSIESLSKQTIEGKRNRNDLVAEIIKDEMAVNKKENGILSTLMMHRQNKLSALKSSFNGQKKLMIKGYTKEQFRDKATFVVAPASYEEELKRDGFVKSSAVKKEKGVDPNKEKMFFYISTSAYQGKYQAGIISFKGQRAKGANLAKMYAQAGDLDPGVAASIARPKITRIKRQQIREIVNGTSTPLDSNSTTLSPIFNSKGQISDYRYKMDEATKLKVIGKDETFDKVLGNMEAAITDKENTSYINNKTVRETYEFYQQNAVKDGVHNTAGYVGIGPNVEDEHYQEIYRMLPDDTKETIDEVWGGDTMYVRSEEAAFIFGQREINLSQDFKKKEIPGDATSKEWIGLMANNAVAYILNRKPVKYAEAIWKEVIAGVKDAIVIKSGVVLIGNIVSNTVLLKVAGVSAKDIAYYHAEAYVGIRQHRKDTEELDTLLLDVKLDPTKKKKYAKRIRELKNEIAINPVTPLIDAGMFQPIVEDINLLDDQNTYQSQLSKWLDENKVTKTIIDKTPNSLKTIAKHAVMAHDTEPYKFMRDATQTSDFVARYTLHKHNLKKGIKPKASINMITKYFINYTPPTHRWLEYANSMGFVMFSKFFFRIQNVLFELARQRPGSLLASLVGQGVLFDIPDITDSNVFDGLKGRINNPLTLAPEIIQSPATVLGVITD